jgi:hypothetical protein
MTTCGDLRKSVGFQPRPLANKTLVAIFYHDPEPLASTPCWGSIPLNFRRVGDINVLGPPNFSGGQNINFRLLFLKPGRTPLHGIYHLVTAAVTGIGASRHFSTYTSDRRVLIASRLHLVHEFTYLHESRIAHRNAYRWLTNWSLAGQFALMTDGRMHYVACCMPA